VVDGRWLEAQERVGTGRGSRKQIRSSSSSSLVRPVASDWDGVVAIDSMKTVVLTIAHYATAHCTSWKRERSERVTEDDGISVMKPRLSESN
jgi:hypothetical protein